MQYNRLRCGVLLCCVCVRELVRLKFWRDPCCWLFNTRKSASVVADVLAKVSEHFLTKVGIFVRAGLHLFLLFKDSIFLFVYHRMMDILYHFFHEQNFYQSKQVYTDVSSKHAIGMWWLQIQHSMLAMDATLLGPTWIWRKQLEKTISVKFEL